MSYDTKKVGIRRQIIRLDLFINVQKYILSINAVVSMIFQLIFKKVLTKNYCWLHKVPTIYNLKLKPLPKFKF